MRALKRVVLGTPACLAHDLNAAGSVVRREPDYERMEGSGGLLLMQWTAPTRRHLGAKMVVFMNHREIGAAL